MNIFFILEDALRPDHLGCYGYEKNTSPNIDKIAREGVVFENAIATASHTLPPVVSMIMGQTTAGHGIVSPKRYEKWITSSFWKNRETSLTILKKTGYEIDGELVLRWKPLGFSRDTDTGEIEAYFEKNRDRKWFFMAEPYPTHLPYNPPAAYFMEFLDPGYKMSRSTKENLSVVQSKLIVHPTGLTSKLEAGEKDPIPDSDADKQHKRTAGVADLKPEDRPAIIASYDGEVRVFDDMVGKWMEKLDALGMYDDTLVIIVSDHGEELMERGHVGHCSCNLKGTLYDESIRVPLILRYPKRFPKGKRVAHQVSQIDIMPTIFDLLELKVPDFIEGQSMLPLILEEARDFREEVYAETTPAGWQALAGDDREIWCVRTEKWKLILNTDSRSSHLEYELYDLTSDPGEGRNIFSRSHPVFRHLDKQLLHYINKARRLKN